MEYETTLHASCFMLHNSYFILVLGELDLSGGVVDPGDLVVRRLVAEVGVVECCVVTTLPHKRVMAAAFDDLAVIDHNDAVGSLHRKKTMRY